MLYGKEVHATVAEVAGGHRQAAAEGWLELFGNFLEIAENIGNVPADKNLRITERTTGDTTATVDGVVITPAPKTIRSKEVERGWALGAPIRPDPTP